MEYFLVVFISMIGASLAAEWSYNGDTAPSFWENTWQACGLTSQSPIDIPFSLEYLDTLQPFTFTGYDNFTADDLTLKNNGHTIVVSIAEDKIGTAQISGGGLSGNYIAAQLHFHWGRNNHQGSEHTFRGRAYPLELHIVHYKASYNDLGTSLGYPDGLAVLGFFFTVSDDDNAHLAPMFSALSNLMYKDQSVEFGTSFDKFLASQTNEFYRYQGSLTTPPCSEAVVWTVFQNKNTVSSSQLAKLRQLYTHEQGETHDHEAHMTFNYRPVQNLGDRTVYKNFESPVPPSWHWGYHGEEGAEHWKEYHSTCSGNHQSPINIPEKDQVVLNETIADLTFVNYDTNITGTILNNGHTIQVNIENTDIYIEHGGLDGRYQAAQFHFHWGHDDAHGSEHTLQNTAYPLELHIVHFKREYGTIGNAIQYTDGLAVVGFLFRAGITNHNYKTIIDALPSVQLKGTSQTIEGFTLRQVTHADIKVSSTEGDELPFYRYQGGLTTPPCSEIVTWTVMMAPVYLSKQQLAQFREMAHVSSVSGQLHEHDKIIENYRPVQNLAGRVVQTSYKLTGTSGSTNLSMTSSIIATIFFFWLLLR